MRALFLAWGSEWPSRCVLTWPLLTLWSWREGRNEGRRKGTFSLPLPVRPQSYQVRTPPLWPRSPFVCVYMLSCPWLFATPQTVACQAPMSMGFSRQEYWSGLPFFSPGRSSQPRDGTWVSCIGRWILDYWASWEAPFNLNYLLKTLSPMQSHWELWFQHTHLRERETIQSIAASLCLR